MSTVKNVKMCERAARQRIMKSFKYATKNPLLLENSHLGPPADVDSADIYAGKRDLTKRKYSEQPISSAY